MDDKEYLRKIERDYNNLNEIVELYEEEIAKNDENISAVLDYIDIRSLKNILECVNRVYKIKEEK